MSARAGARHSTTGLPSFCQGCAGVYGRISPEAWPASSICCEDPTSWVTGASAKLVLDPGNDCAARRRRCRECALHGPFGATRPRFPFDGRPVRAEACVGMRPSASVRCAAWAQRMAQTNTPPEGGVPRVTFYVPPDPGTRLAETCATGGMLPGTPDAHIRKTRSAQ